MATQESEKYFVALSHDLKDYLGSGFVVNVKGVWYIRGIVSSSWIGANRHCDVTKNTIFTKISEFSSWIREKMGNKIPMLLIPVKCLYTTEKFFFSQNDGEK